MFLNLKSFARSAPARALVAFALCAAAAAAHAQPVIVGVYDPATRQSRALHERLVGHFLDGTPITKMYTAYSRTSQSFYLVRGGLYVHGAGCRHEVFRLVPLAGNKLAIADPVAQSAPWQPGGILTKIYATFDCTSFSCSDCISSDPQDHLGAGTSLESPQCTCSQDTGGGGECVTNKPGLGGAYGSADIAKKPSF